MKFLKRYAIFSVCAILMWFILFNQLEPALVIAGFNILAFIIFDLLISFIRVPVKKEAKDV